MHHAGIADYWGLTIETLSRTKAKKLIDIPKNSEVTILQRDALMHLCRGHGAEQR
jgi:hypothetical protein